MIKLRTVLLSNKLYIILIILVLIFSLIRININNTSKYNINTRIIEGIIIDKYIDGNKIDLTIKGKEKIICTKYFNKYNDLKKYTDKYNLGDNVIVYGDILEIENTKTKNIFNYKKYLQRQNIFYKFKIDFIEKKHSNKSLYYFIKSKIIKRINNNPYLLTFILGDKRYLNNEVKETYQNNGISHLFAISGMHINLFAGIILKLLKKLKVKENKRYYITSIILIIYLLLTGITSSILRGVLFFILFSINKIYYFYIKNTNIFILTLSISLLINPNFIYDVGCWYSFSISLTLISMANYINKYSNYITKLLITSIISFIVSIPITLYNFYTINVLSIIYNLFYVPLVSIIIFPLSLLTYIFPVLNPIYNIFTNILEFTSLKLNEINILKFIFPKLNIVVYILYIIVIVIFFIGLSKKIKLYYIPLILLIIFNYNYKNNNYLYTIDVGQGDSSILKLNNKTILIDTGGKTTFKKEKWQYQKSNNSIVKNTTIPLLKSLGIRKINYAVITHGDYDHMGEAINLVNNFKVETVIFNCGEFNDLEKELIKVLDKKNIKYYSCIKELNIDNNKLYFLQTKEYDNENDNSNVIYTELDGYKFMFMGDAGVTTEKEILNKYNLSDIDVLKVGHHGSRTSSSKEFINEINPNYSIISVGKNNRYGHPNKEALDNLKDSKIYRTDEDGSIMFKIKNNKLNIETCSP